MAALIQVNGKGGEPENSPPKPMKHSSLAGRIRCLSSHPSNPIEGEEYFNTTYLIYYRYNGSNWLGVEMTTTSTTTSTSTSTSTSTTTT